MSDLNDHLIDDDGDVLMRMKLRMVIKSKEMMVEKIILDRDDDDGNEDDEDR